MQSLGMDCQLDGNVLMLYDTSSCTLPVFLSGLNGPPPAHYATATCTYIHTHQTHTLDFSLPARHAWFHGPRRPSDDATDAQLRAEPTVHAAATRPDGRRANDDGSPVHDSTFPAHAGRSSDAHVRTRCSPAVHAPWTGASSGHARLQWIPKPRTTSCADDGSSGISTRPTHVRHEPRHDASIPTTRLRAAAARPK